MDFLDLTLPSPAENLALDEALFEQANQERNFRETLRIWESSEFCVILGRSSRAREELHVEVCQRRGIPVLRRCSGGAAVVIGPGCLMYSLAIHHGDRPEWQSITGAHADVHSRFVQTLGSSLSGIAHEGTSDLAWNGRKFSGNSLRRGRHGSLYHGTMLYDFPLQLVTELLASPPRQPAYRRQRSHGAFITNLPLTREALSVAIEQAWQTSERRQDLPRARVRRLARERYDNSEWTWKYE